MVPKAINKNKPSPWIKNINQMLKNNGKIHQTGIMRYVIYSNGTSDFLKDIEKTEPYQIVYEIERLHEDGKRQEIALSYVKESGNKLKQLIQGMEAEQSEYRKFIEETENIGIVKFEPNEVKFFN